MMNNMRARARGIPEAVPPGLAPRREPDPPNHVGGGERTAAAATRWSPPPRASSLQVSPDNYFLPPPPVLAVGRRNITTMLPPWGEATRKATRRPQGAVAGGEASSIGPRVYT